MREYVFAQKKPWAIDIALPEQKIAIEIQGGIFSRGGHVRPRGYCNDVEKSNALATLGWKLYQIVASGNVHYLTKKLRKPRVILVGYDSVLEQLDSYLDFIARSES